MKRTMKLTTILSIACMTAAAFTAFSLYAAAPKTVATAVAKADKDTPDGWFDQFDKAKETAAKDKKAMLLLFTGSDWCPWCVKLHDNVLSKDEFKKFAAEKLVLVYIDRPQSKKLPAEVEKQNAKLANDYKVSGYPCTVIVASDGTKELGRISGYAEDFTKRVSDILEGKAPAEDKAASYEDVSKLFDYLPDPVAELNGQKITRKEFLDELTAIPLEILKKIQRDQLKEVIGALIDDRATKILAEKAGIKPTADMFKNLLREQISIMPPAQKAELDETIKESGVKNFDEFLENEAKSMDGKYEEMLTTAYAFSVAKSLAEKELPKITEKEIKEFYEKNQAACTVDGKLLPLDKELTEKIRKTVSFNKITSKVPDVVQASIDGLNTKIFDFKPEKK